MIAELIPAWTADQIKVNFRAHFACSHFAIGLNRSHLQLYPVGVRVQAQLIHTWKSPQRG